ncbi:hypothetical protein CERZMDRAFT_99093 [Cercospora zeae-maydis SCOH1-5]|uniref:Uncharacterized protein n=1 Tax=Cercospora zeae-maydis SCOH1-5 TaxID=717836 RepID=A0A6A6FBY7_9PEZI|nr:hypothetical protein CERZMDRAFT_99093 [Cercospora zeae-maydis SCOH1-5]
MRELAEEDLRPVTAILPRSKSLLNVISKGVGFETWEVAANPQHRCYCASEITPNEVFTVECFDSKKDGRARRRPHTAFQSEFGSGPGRRSIKIGCLVFWKTKALNICLLNLLDDARSIVNSLLEMYLQFKHRGQLF